jgi:hypothetical protein
MHLKSSGDKVPDLGLSSPNLTVFLVTLGFFRVFVLRLSFFLLFERDRERAVLLELREREDGVLRELELLEVVLL